MPINTSEVDHVKGEIFGVQSIHNEGIGDHHKRRRMPTVLPKLDKD
jgi:hypothetical protein